MIPLSQLEVDPLGIALTLVGLQFFALPLFIPVFLIYANLDPLYHIIPADALGMWTTPFRFIVIFIPTCDSILFLGALHIMVMQLVHHTKKAFLLLQTYKVCRGKQTEGSVTVIITHNCK
jgi:hypothetical protein